MHKDQEDEQRTDIFYEKQIYGEETSAKSAIVGELVPHHLMRHKPAYKKACEETTQREEHLTGNKIEYVEQRLTKKRKALHTT